MRMFSYLLMSCVVAVSAAGSVRADAKDGWVSLFDGRTLEGWKASDAPGSFRVQDGAIACDGPRSHLFYVGPGAEPGFTNFELSADVLSRPGANSGLYFHTAWQATDWPKQGFEVQINNTQPAHGDYLELKKTGSLYGIRNTYKALVRDDEWFTMHVTVRGPRVQVRLNDTLVVDYREPEGAVPGMKEPLPRLGRGTFALQCHDPGSKVSFRNLKVRTLAAPSREEAGPPPVIDPHYAQRHDLARANFPVLDLHVHLKGGLELEEALRRSRESGIALGIAVNAGQGFPIETDAGIEAFHEQMRGQPVFIGMQAEGREWVDMFSRQARARFDYVFTDGMTLTDHRGKRTRLWIAEEVAIDDNQAFMERLVSTIVGILEEEPIDVYVNPTFLPAVIADRYDTLWTDERMGRVIGAAVKSGVAVEINNRYRIPSPAFLKKARDAGVKFTCGTNNAGADLGDFAYCLEMQRALDLSWKHMWVPGHGQKRAERD
jgi:hypothetical protein